MYEAPDFGTPGLARPDSKPYPCCDAPDNAPRPTAIHPWPHP